jgi:aryl-alcohol dehydrogenase-like predicted oxidoreductase
LGNSELWLTTVGFSTERIRSDFSNTVADRSTIQGVLRSGINWIATSPEWNTERVTGDAITEWTGETPCLVARCLAVRSTKEGPEVSVPRDAGEIHEAFNETRRRLQTDVIDLYEADWPVGSTASAWGALADLQQQGHIRAVGVVNQGIEHLRAAYGILPVAALKTRLGILCDDGQRALLGFCSEHGIGVLGQLPAIGSIPGSGRNEAGTRLRIATTLGVCTADEWLLNPRAHETKLQRALAIIDEMGKIGTAHRRSADAVAIAWALRLAAVTGIVVDNPGPAWLATIVGDSAFDLSDEEFARIKAIQG